MEKTITINNKKLKLTNLEKIFWPDEKYTKGDLINYYDSVSKYILPYLIDRPQTLKRYPNGINSKSFFQKDVKGKIADWIKTTEVYSESTKEKINYLLCQDKATLIYTANLGCIDMNPWSSTYKNPEKPDYLLIDLDPLDVSFDAVIQTALAVKEILDRAKAKGFCKTSGATGIHIYIPLAAKYEYDKVRDFGEIICRLTNELLPVITSCERMPPKRKKKVYVDYLQNSRGQTLASPYSVRPFPHAPVSAPLDWKELKKGLTPEDFTIKTIYKRLNKKGDIFKGALGKGIDMMKCLKNLGE